MTYKTPLNFVLGRFRSIGGVLVVENPSEEQKLVIARALKLGVIEEVKSTLDDFKTLSMDELKEKYTVAQLVEIAKGLSIRNIAKLKEEELIAKIMERA